MTDHTFPCKDCNEVYPDAYSFVAHIETCVPVRDQALLLQDAAMLLRRLLHATDGLVTSQSGTRLISEMHVWLKKNNLQGSIMR